jgi:hypothetical protein
MPSGTGAGSHGADSDRRSIHVSRSHLHSFHVPRMTRNPPHRLPLGITPRSFTSFSSPSHLYSCSGVPHSVFHSSLRLCPLPAFKLLGCTLSFQSFLTLLNVAVAGLLPVLLSFALLSVFFPCFPRLLDASYPSPVLTYPIH